MRVPAPVAKVQKFLWDLGWIRKNLHDPAHPFRYLYGDVQKALHPTETMQRRKVARDISAKLDPEIAKAIEEFRREGMVKVNHLVDPALLKELSEYFENTVVPRRNNISGLDFRPFFTQLRTEEDLKDDNITVRFALQDKIVRLVTAYMGKLPFVRNLSYLESNGIDQTTWEQSQLWHLDYYFTYLSPSIWVYLSDVETEEDGPFTYLPVAASERVNKTWMPRRVPDAEIESSGLTSEIRQIRGPRLTCFMVDNSRIYHLGSRMKKGHRRSAYISLYVEPVGEKSWFSSNAVPPERRLLFTRG